MIRHDVNICFTCLTNIGSAIFRQTDLCRTIDSYEVKRMQNRFVRLLLTVPANEYYISPAL